jgi:S1-C subfamily serine protease
MAIAIERELITHSLSDQLAAVAERARAATVLIYRGDGNGAGVIWRADGEIVTNKHVVGNSRQVDVVLADGRKFTGIVASRHPERDLAIVKIAADDLPVASIGDSSTVRPGQLAIAVGHPLGFRDAVTAGVVVAAGQAATESGPRTGDHLQADLTLLPGNSGGPLIDAWGAVIGINTMVAGALALAIPSQAVEHFVAAGPDVRPNAYLGIEVKFIDALRRGGFAAGLLITGVVEGAPADRAGLIIGDVIISFAEITVVDQETLPAALLKLKPGEAVNVSVLRGDELRTFTVVPTERALDE